MNINTKWIKEMPERVSHQLFLKILIQSLSFKSGFLKLISETLPL